MRYVLTDLHGNQRGAYDSRDELIEDLQDGLRDDPATLKDLYVLTYDDEGREVDSPRRGDAALVDAMRGFVITGTTTDLPTETARPVAGLVGTGSRAESA
jgi:hypothetical protein